MASATPVKAPSLSIYTGFNMYNYIQEMRFLTQTIQRRRDFVVAGAIRLKAVFFLAYRGRHPQSVEAVLAGILIVLSIGTFSVAAQKPL